MESGTDRVVELAYSKAGRLELVVPHGTRIADVAQLRETLFTDILQRLPRGCQACLSGDNLNIRERFEHVIRVDLDSMEILGQ